MRRSSSETNRERSLRRRLFDRFGGIVPVAALTIRLHPDLPLLAVLGLELNLPPIHLLDRLRLDPAVGGHCRLLCLLEILRLAEGDAALGCWATATDGTANDSQKDNLPDVSHAIPRSR